MAAGEVTNYSKFIKAVKKQDIDLRVECQCDRLRKISELFYCKKCVEFSCDQCAKRQIENFFCPQCLNPYHSFVVKKKLSRCHKCVACPVCDSFLEKVYLMGENHLIFQCPFCFWTSNTLGFHAKTAQALVDQINQVEAETHQKLSGHVMELIRKYQTKLDEGSSPGYLRNLNSGKRTRPKYLKGLSDANWQVAARSAKHTNNVMDKIESLEKKRQEKFDKANEGLNEKSFGVDDAPEVSQRFIRQFELSQYTSIRHRMANPARQVKKMERLCPTRRKLMTKISYRCPNDDCNTYLIKPSMALRECTFDHQSLAIEVLPWIVLQQPLEPLKINEPVPVTLRMTNMTDQMMFLKVEAYPVDYDRFSNTHVETRNTEFVQVRDAQSIEAEYTREYHDGGHWTEQNTAGFVFSVKATTPVEPAKFCVGVELKTGIPQADGSFKSFTIPFRLHITLPAPVSSSEDAEE